MMSKSIPQFLIHLPVYGPLDCFQFRAITKKHAMSFGVQVSYWACPVISLEYILQMEWVHQMEGLNKDQTYFHNGGMIYTKQQCLRIPFPLHPNQHLVWSVFKILFVLVDPSSISIWF